jgi:hypothetical protein
LKKIENRQNKRERKKFKDYSFSEEFSQTVHVHEKLNLASSLSLIQQRGTVVTYSYKQELP